jgi:hypothetical protein
VVQHLQQLQRKDGHGRPLTVIYFFFKHLQPEKRTLIAILLSFLSQMAFQDDVCLDLIYQRVLTVDQQNIRSISLLRELAELVLKAQSRCFVVVDALDKCTGEPPSSVEVAQGEVIDWLEFLMSESIPGAEASALEEERQIRLLICGQRNGFLESRLRPYPAIELDSCAAHVKDIEAYS